MTEERAFQPLEPPHRRAARYRLLALLGFVGLCLLVGVANGAVTAGSVRDWYPALAKPPGTPPTWVFGPVWTTLYLMLGVAAWLVWRRVDVGAERKRAALRLWGWQLLLNALWPAAFFGFRNPAAGLAVLAALLVVAVASASRFARLQRGAAVLLLPYVAWLGYAAYLNAGILLLNR